MSPAQQPMRPECAGKIRYADKAAALHFNSGVRPKAKRLRRLILRGAHVYRCPACHGWHRASRKRI